MLKLHTHYKTLHYTNYITKINSYIFLMNLTLTNLYSPTTSKLHFNCTFFQENLFESIKNLTPA